MAADSALFVGWNRPAVGKEAAALEMFQGFMAFYGKLAASGRIESFEPVLLDPHGGDLNGFTLVRGSAEQLHKLRHDEEFRDLLVRSNNVVLGIGVIDASIGDALQREVVRYAKFAK